jgi:hypothetical protein
VYGIASNTGDVTNYGGSFQAYGSNGKGVYGYAAGTSGIGVEGNASNTGDVINYGGYFQAQGTSGRGVYGEATGTDGRGVLGYASGTSGIGVYGGATGNSGKGVYGYAFNTGDVTNYGGFFQSKGTYGRGVFGEAIGTSGRGVFGSATNTGDVINYGGYFQAQGTSGRGVYGYATNSDGVVNYGGSFRADGSSGSGVYGYAIGTSGKGVYGHASNTGDVENYGGWFKADGGSGTGVFGSATNTGDVSNIGGKFYAAGANGRGVRGQAAGINGIGVVGNGPSTGYDFYAGGAGTDYGPFTGGHEVKLSNNFPEEVQSGMIVSLTGETQFRKLENGTVSISSTLPTVELSRTANNKAVFGVFDGETPLPEDHWYEGKKGERFGRVNALGEGRVWVTNINGDIEAGDYVTTSEIPGIGHRQDDDLLHSYTLGKAIETVDWDAVTETVEHQGKTFEIYLLAVVYTSG